MPTYTPESQIDNSNYNPSNKIAREIVNSGYPLTQDFLSAYQYFMQIAVQNQVLDFIKWPGMALAKQLPLYVTPYNRSFELLSHVVLGGSPTSHQVIINSGVAYSATDRLCCNYRTTTTLQMTTDQDNRGEAFVCIRSRGALRIDYQENPLTGVSEASKVLPEIEVFLSDSTIELASGFYYPEFDTDTNKIPGVVIAKISNSGTPDVSQRTALIAVKDGSPLDFPGFLSVNPSAID
jgi:hypothetical protein